MWKVCKYTLIDLARNRFALGYAALLLVVSVGLFQLEGDPTKALISLTQVALALVPLLALVFTIIYYYNQYEFTVLLAVQPLRRRSIVLAQWAAINIAMLVAFLFGIGMPVLVYSPDAAGWTLLLTGAALTAVFTAIGAWIAVKNRDRARGVGIGLVTWVLMVLVYDALLLWIMFAFSDRPIEPVIVPLAAFNPIDLARILVMLRIDLAALLGYTGAVYQQFFGTAGGMLVAFLALLLWVLLPCWRTVRAFRVKDLEWSSPCACPAPVGCRGGWWPLGAFAHGAARCAPRPGSWTGSSVREALRTDRDPCSSGSSDHRLVVGGPLRAGILPAFDFADHLRTSVAIKLLCSWPRRSRERMPGFGSSHGSRPSACRPLRCM
ncbi:MAG: hypothetical protein IPH53_16805 [Flavobacteriales bacterium]|nr:hypothetical protein [Flavobacteriales bacterium]